MARRRGRRVGARVVAARGRGRVAGAPASRARRRGGHRGPGCRRAGPAARPGRRRCRRGRGRPGCPAGPSRAWWRWTPGGPARPRGAPARSAPPPRAWSGSHCSRASCSTGPRAGSRFDRAVTARCRSTNATASRESWVVARATWRALHACSRPSWTSAQSRGSRWRSSTASDTSDRPGGVREVQGRGELLDRVLGHRRGPGPGQRGPVEERRTQRGREPAGPLGREGWRPGARGWPGAGRPSAPPAPAAGPPAASAARRAATTASSTADASRSRTSTASRSSIRVLVMQRT